MKDNIQARINTLGIELPRPSKPGGSYVPYHFSGNLLFVTGQLCHWNGERLFVGKLGADFDIEDGRKAARICGLKGGWSVLSKQFAWPDISTLPPIFMDNCK